VGAAKLIFQVHPGVVIEGMGIGRANHTGKTELMFAILVADFSGGLIGKGQRLPPVFMESIMGKHLGQSRSRTSGRLLHGYGGATYALLDCAFGSGCGIKNCAFIFGEIL
jgi:hypothetical protein